MNKLLKADFYALIKSKMLYILIAICIILPIISMALLKGIDTILQDEESFALGLSLTTGRRIILSNFNISSNVGLLVPIFAGIFTMSDVRHGTLRNKVTTGKSRTKIYFSHLIVSITFSLAMVLISILISLLGSLILFKYGYPLDKNEAFTLVRCFITGFLTFAFIATLTTFLALGTKSLPMTIIFTVVITFALNLISGFYGMVPEKYSYIFYFIPTFSNYLVVSYPEDLSVKVFFFGLISLLIFSSINTIFGLLLFKKKDLK